MIYLKFIKFDLEHGDNNTCVNDFVEVGTVKLLNTGTDRSSQTVHTKMRLLPK